VADEKTRHLT